MHDGIGLEFGLLQTTFWRQFVSELSLWHELLSILPGEPFKKMTASQDWQHEYTVIFPWLTFSCSNIDVVIFPNYQVSRGNVTDGKFRSYSWSNSHFERWWIEMTISSAHECYSMLMASTMREQNSSFEWTATCPDAMTRWQKTTTVVNTEGKRCNERMLCYGGWSFRLQTQSIA